MNTSEPLQIQRGYCIGETRFEQHGQIVNRDDVMRRLGRYKDTAPYVQTGNTLAVLSIVTSLTAITSLALHSSGAVHDEGASRALLITGLATAVGSWPLCITADGRYAKAAEVYNARVGAYRRRNDDDSSPTSDRARPTNDRGPSE
ncbi:MAG: hypothetical protein ACOY0T_18325 [Myxococcota bacterium]